MNKIILLGNMTRNPKTTRKTAEDGSEVVITKFDLAVNRRSKQIKTVIFHPFRMRSNRSMAGR